MQKIVKSNLVNEVYSQLLNMLASGEYPEGSKLPSETQLSEQLGVSRNTIRTAMSKLIALGLVENQQGYGNCVLNMNMGVCTSAILPTMLANARDLEAMTEFRIGVESMAARLAAERSTEEEIRLLHESYLRAEDAVRSNDKNLFAKYDLEFHRLIAKASGNQLFFRAAEMLEVMYTTWMVGFQRVHGIETSFEYHKRIYKAIAAHQSQEAYDAMKDHLEDVLRKVKLDSAAAGY